MVIPCKRPFDQPSHCPHEEKYADEFKSLGVNPNFGLDDLYKTLEHDTGMGQNFTTPPGMYRFFTRVPILGISF